MATGVDRLGRSAAAVALALLVATAANGVAARAADEPAAESGASEPPAGVILAEGGVAPKVGDASGGASALIAPDPEAFPAPAPDETIPLAEPQKQANRPVRLVAAARAPLAFPGVVVQTGSDETRTEPPVREAAGSDEPQSGAGRPQRNALAEQDERRERSRQKDKEGDGDKDASKGACGEQAKDCRKALRDLRDDGISTIGLDIRVGGRPGSDYPCECRLEGEKFQPRRFATTMFTWKAAGYCHKPLYFEDWNLERYGHSHGKLADPFVSAAHFFVSLPVLPYKMGVELPWECVYPLGYYRPGNCAPWTVPAVPISARGFAVEAATVTGLVFLLP